MRCAQFQPLAKKTNKETDHPPPPRIPSSPLSPLHQPNSSLASILGGSVFATSAGLPTSSSSTTTIITSSTMIRRSQRGDSAKHQSNLNIATTNNSNSVSSLRAVNASLKNQACKASQRNLSSLKSQHIQGPSSAKSDGTAAAAALVKMNQSDSARPGSGRHPHPPSANNTKLKHKCPFDGCPWKFATPYKLRRHIKSHTKETPYLCKECGRGFSVRYNLLMHIQTIHSQPQKYKCPIRGCKDAFHSQSRLNGHLRRIHKKDWKTLSKDINAKSSNIRGSSTSSTDSLDSNASIDAPPTVGMRKPRPHGVQHKCPRCSEGFSSKVKLASHVKLHAPDKNFMCAVQSCGKSFTGQDKLNRHAEMHKNSKQFCCPHKNCNRIFLRQTHLRNHLKIHTQDHQFVCPVLDCSQKFASESAYNVHLNTHINYGYNCPHQNCELSFLSRKRLAIHTQVVHNMYINPETGISSPLLDGIQPHLGMSRHPSLNSPSSPPSLLPLSITGHCHSQQHSSSKATFFSRRVIDNDFIKNIDLPGLSVNDIEAVLSENEDWSGEQIDQFLRSAVDLSEIESKLFSLASYESDSGYSTYDVSPLTSTAPANLNYAANHAMSSCPPPLTLVGGHAATSPLFGNPAFPGMAMQHHSPSLVHDPTVSPCASDVGFFSPHSGFNSLASTPNHESISFFPSAHSPASLYSNKSFAQQPQDFNMSSVFSVSNTVFPDLAISSTIPSFSVQIPDILLHDNHMPSLRPLSANNNISNAATTKYLSCSHQAGMDTDVISQKKETALEGTEEEEGSDGDGGTVSQSLFAVKREGEGGDEDSAAFEGHGSSLDVLLPQVDGTSVSGSLLEDSIETGGLMIASSTGTQHGEDGAGTDILLGGESPQKRRGKGGVSKPSRTSSLKGTQKKKTQWPKSMNRANLIAFREHILNKLKNGHEVNAVPVPVFSEEGSPSKTTYSSSSSSSSSSAPPPQASSSHSSIPPLIKCEAFSPTSQFELQVKYERNHVIPERCHSEPADLQSLVLHSSSSSSSAMQMCSKSDGDINSASSSPSSSSSLGGPHDIDEIRLTGRECEDLLSVFSFNPDTLLSSSHSDDRLLDDFSFKFGAINNEMGIEISDFLVDNNRISSQQPLTAEVVAAGATTIPLEDVDELNINTIQELLDYSEEPMTSASSPSHPYSCQQSPLGSCSTTLTGLSRSSSLCSMNNMSTQCSSSSSSGSPRSKEDLESVPFQFPEIFSVQGSMVLDGVGVASTGSGSEGGVEPDYHIDQPFLQSHHDPLLGDSHSCHTPNSVKMFNN